MDEYPEISQIEYLSDDAVDNMLFWEDVEGNCKHVTVSDAIDIFLQAAKGALNSPGVWGISYKVFTTHPHDGRRMKMLGVKESYERRD